MMLSGHHSLRSRCRPHAFSLALVTLLVFAVPLEAQQCDKPEDCEDGNPCTVEACILGECVSEVAPNGTACDNGLFCTVDESCLDGVCQGGSPRDCNDDEECTVDTCDENGALCVNDSAGANGLPCASSLFCTVDQTCLAGTCQGGAPRDCDDSEECTVDSCDENGDVCVNDGPAANGLPCTSDSFCTVDQTCLAGACQGGAPRDCDDNQECTVDSCDENGDACVNDGPAANGLPCTSDSFCTVDQACLAGACQGGSPRDCNDEEDCTIDSCDEDGDACINDGPAANGLPCADNNPCTIGDTCSGGSCVGGASLDCSEFDGPCTVGDCNTSNGKCEPQPANEGLECDDLDLCTLDDVCVSGQCAGTINDCDDGSTCTDDVCDPLDPKAGPDGCLNSINSFPPFAVGAGARTIEVTPQASPTDHPIALEVRSPNFECLVKWLTPTGPGTAAFGDVPVFLSPTDWGTRFVTDEDIVPSGGLVPVEYHLRASCGQDALGEHTFTNDPFDNPDGIAITFIWGDVNNDGVVDLDDILCMTAGFGGDFSLCTLQNLDLFPCQPNGYLDLDDILVILTAFSGDPFPCAIPCGGACCLNLPGTLCEPLPPDQCADLGGEYQGEGSLCLPNPCGS